MNFPKTWSSTERDLYDIIWNLCGSNHAVYCYLRWLVENQPSTSNEVVLLKYFFLSLPFTCL